MVCRWPGHGFTKSSQLCQSRGAGLKIRTHQSQSRKCQAKESLETTSGFRWVPLSKSRPVILRLRAGKYSQLIRHFPCHTQWEHVRLEQAPSIRSDGGIDLIREVHL
jgi:hypothetical protein